ncbi:hypothetical protein B1F79_01130 [Coxiella-like endosymbiont of Rhipicephalus sanguineus]|nr:hypothetical protein [Coxiella-like endosymbiont of Rhipicephalus sanguineus]
MEQLRKGGVFATEMESFIIFTLASLYSYRFSKGFQKPSEIIKVGSILAIVRGIRRPSVPIRNLSERLFSVPQILAFKALNSYST